MNTKKLIGVFVVMSSLVLLAGCGSKETTTTDDAVISGAIDATTAVVTPSNLTKDEQCIEIMAYALKGAEYQQKGDINTFMERAKKVDALVKKYDLDDQDYEVLCQGFAIQPNFMEKVQKRIAEL